MSFARIRIRQGNRYRLVIESFDQCEVALLKIRVLAVTVRIGRACREDFLQDPVLACGNLIDEVNVGRHNAVEDDGTQSFRVISHEMQTEQRAVGDAIEVVGVITQCLYQHRNVGGVLKAIEGRQVDAFRLQSGIAGRQGFVVKAVSLV